jgi:hypothetical protein
MIDIEDRDGDRHLKPARARKLAPQRLQQIIAIEQARELIMVGHDAQDRLAPCQLGRGSIKVRGEVLALGL